MYFVGFPKIMLDNESTYFGHLKGIIESVDELSTTEVSNLGKEYNVRIAPSTANYINPLLEELFKFNNQFGIKLDVSKSIKTTGVINFKINKL